MIKIENVVLPSTEQWLSVIRGARNPMNSWDKSDSSLESGVGEKDLDLLHRLSEAGSDHGKFLRMLPVIMDVTAPMYMWPEADQYKVGTVTNSCSKMHRLMSKEFSVSDFSFERIAKPYVGNGGWMVNLNTYTTDLISILNDLREIWLKEKDPVVKKEIWYSVLQILPESYNQKRTMSVNYQVLKSMYHARKDHKLDEWKSFCGWIETLPYAKELIIF